MALVHGIKPIVTSGLVLCLDAANRKSYPGSGLTWTDLSGRGNNGTLSATSIGYNSANGGSLVFDGTDDYVNFSFVNPFAETVIVWARSATSNWNAYAWISSSRRQNGHIIHPTPAIRTIDYYIVDSSASFPTLIGSVTPDNITIPHMYAYSTNGSNLHKGYLDGIEVVSSSSSITRTASPSNQVWYLGKDDNDGRYGNGNIYACLRYNRQLTATEIAQNYNALKGRYGLS
tara:strand:+ start:68 stop:760 length:693 start_codon:yes stop_codon:yes gene_type:complete